MKYRNAKKGILITSVLLVVLSMQANAAPKKHNVKKRVSALEAQVQVLATDLNEIELTPGPQGVQGVKGEDGATGAQGSQGSQGSQGIAGTDGISGVDGNKGETGAIGPQGETGSAGVNGSSCTAIQGNGSATISCDNGTMASVYDQDGSSVSGNNPGDMQYWDGSEWVLITAPTADANYILSSCKGYITWTQNGCPYEIGDTGPAGGIVFYVNDNGLHGLEAAPEDQSGNASWGCIETEIDGADNNSVGSGAQNTTDIVAGCADEGIAAKIADAYQLNDYADWFLPSKDELILLYQQQEVVGGFSADGYWSSSEIDSSNAYARGFGRKTLNEKWYTQRVRAIRAF